MRTLRPRSWGKLLKYVTVVSSEQDIEHDVFISYAHEDYEFVRMLRGWLEAAGFSVWLDEERMRGGRRLDEDIAEALQKSRQAIFILSESWANSKWGGWELGVFLEEPGKEGKGIPILRTPLRKKEIPVDLGGAFLLEWFEKNQISDDACFWKLYCALRGWSPEGKDDWDQMGRLVRGNAQQGGGSVLLSRSDLERAKRDLNRARFGPARAALRCDRTPQWKAIEDHAGLDWHEALFVQGADHESPELFLEALQHCYPETPPRRIVPVAWSSGHLPRTKAEFLDELVSALGCRRGALIQALRDELRKQHLVLVHRPQLPAALRSDTLVRYYTRHMPELISQLGETTKAIKLIQGIVWSDKDQSEAQQRIQEIPAHKELPIILLKPLERITPEDVESWSQTLPPGTDRAAIVARALQGATSSAAILSRIIEDYGNSRGRP